GHVQEEAGAGYGDTGEDADALIWCRCFSAERKSVVALDSFTEAINSGIVSILWQKDSFRQNESGSTILLVEDAVSSKGQASCLECYVHCTALLESFSSPCFSSNRSLLLRHHNPQHLDGLGRGIASILFEYDVNR